MSAEEQSRLLNERDVLIEKYQEYIHDFKDKYNNWILEGKCNELGISGWLKNYRKL